MTGNEPDLTKDFAMGGMEGRATYVLFADAVNSFEVRQDGPDYVVMTPFVPTLEEGRGAAAQNMTTVRSKTTTQRASSLRVEAPSN